MALHQRLAEQADTIRDLRARLDAEAEERRTAQAKLTALLTDRTSPAPDQRVAETAGVSAPRRSWWPWRRRAES